MSASDDLAKCALQRRVEINGEEVSGDPNAGYQRNDAVQVVPDNAQTWVADGYRRDYADDGEFQAHATGNPSRVGLAKKPGIWFRLHHLPGPGHVGQFFVLGENHGAFGYRELIAETNQTGDVLGEGGANQPFAAKPISPLVPTQAIGNGGQEYTMENRLAKGYYAFAAAAKTQRKIANGTYQAPAAKRTVPEDQWIAEYQGLLAVRGNPRTRGQLPSYLDAGEEVFADFGGGGNQYNAQQTIQNNIADLIAALQHTVQNPFPGMDPNDAQLAADTALNLLNLNGIADDSDKYESMRRLLPDVERLALLETHRTQGNIAFQPNQPLDPAIVSSSSAAKNAFEMRNEAMFANVVKARNAGGFIMAAMGDNHRRDLQARFAGENPAIPTVTHSDFLAGGVNVDSQDAVDP